MTTPRLLTRHATVGPLELLPLDVPTLTGFRRVNRRAMELVDSLHQYQMVWKHCSDVLRAIISIGAGSFSCRALYETLLTTKCSTCDRFGGYLYLITCTRVCYFCFTRDTSYHPLSTRQATRITGLSRKTLKSLVLHIISLPGRYTAFAKLSRKRTLLLDRRAVLRLARPDNGQHQQQQLDYTTREPRRYMSIISAPYLTNAGQRAEWGLHCRRCKDNTDDANNFRHQFTRKGPVAHINQQHTAMVVLEDKGGVL